MALQGNILGRVGGGGGGGVRLLIDKSEELLAQRFGITPSLQVNLISPCNDILYIHPLALLTRAVLCMSASSLYPPSSLVNPGIAEYIC